jgi:hypothetical protein
MPEIRQVRELYTNHQFFLLFFLPRMRLRPTKGMIENIKLPGIITDNNQTLGQSITKDAADQSAFCGDFDISADA